MQDRFRALLVTKDRERQSARVTELTDSDLMDGDVTVSVEYSTVNYKDGLAVTGKAPIIRKFPLIPGVDLAGRVLRSQNPDFHEGDRVVLNGYGLGEAHHGGFAERARVKSDWLIPLPQGISTAQAMAIGTAGFTAMLCVMALEKAGITPGSGDVLVTGAAGGVGSVAISHIKYDGAVAACGLAQGSDLPATVLPFILRNVTLIGVDSVMAPREKRQAAWHRLASDLDLSKLDKMTTKIALDDVPAVAEQIVAGKTRGRVVIDLKA